MCGEDVSYIYNIVCFLLIFNYIYYLYYLKLNIFFFCIYFTVIVQTAFLLYNMLSFNGCSNFIYLKKLEFRFFFLQLIRFLCIIALGCMIYYLYYLDFFAIVNFIYYLFVYFILFLLLQLILFLFSFLIGIIFFPLVLSKYWSLYITYNFVKLKQFIMFIFFFLYFFLFIYVITITLTIYLLHFYTLNNIIFLIVFMSIFLLVHIILGVYINVVKLDWNCKTYYLIFLYALSSLFATSIVFILLGYILISLFILVITLVLLGLLLYDIIEGERSNIVFSYILVGFVSITLMFPVLGLCQLYTNGYFGCLLFNHKLTGLFTITILLIVIGLFLHEFIVGELRFTAIGHLVIIFFALSLIFPILGLFTLYDKGWFDYLLNILKFIIIFNLEHFLVSSFYYFGRREWYNVSIIIYIFIFCGYFLFRFIFNNALVGLIFSHIFFIYIFFFILSICSLWYLYNKVKKKRKNFSFICEKPFFYINYILDFFKYISLIIILFFIILFILLFWSGGLSSFFLQCIKSIFMLFFSLHIFLYFFMFLQLNFLFFEFFRLVVNIF